MDESFEELLIGAIKALTDALSYVDEFDAQTFMSSVFGSSEGDKDSKRAGRYAMQFLENANSMICRLMKYHPNAGTPEERKEANYWISKKHYTSVLRLFDLLQKSVTVIPFLNKTIGDLNGVTYTVARKGLLGFRKQCEQAIFNLNSVVESYNRFAPIDRKLPKVEL